MKKASNHSDNTVLWQKQSDLLITAINNYLNWRNNKELPDGRNYVVTIWTLLRHMTSFGEQRANDLLQQLQAKPVVNPLVLLQQHFSEDSKLHNHSLDTYILEAIHNNPMLFLIPNYLKILPLTNQMERMKLQNNLIQMIPESALESTRKVACQYMKSDYQKACYYLKICVDNDHVRAEKDLKKLAKKIS